ncbi:MAG: UDP-N-acetylglucosamine 1-carboxyvinyltransferase [Rickettsiales bacterium]|jgi:UDP-N-acetylglucosamine 1-carboxyvinyltransferase|nr:UDP-N-acetylglucosamine 1-carboxyvinyltransferase [Rickettsiales bacterium]
MRKLLIGGGNELRGEVSIAGAKNASLPILVSTLLIDDYESVITNIPNIVDINIIAELLMHLGVNVKISDGTAVVDSRTITSTEAPYEIVNKMRASFWVLGSLLGRFGEAKVSLPGGCAIGLRPCDIYIDALNKMEIETKVENGYVVAKAKKNNRPQGADITFRLPSVGATHNTIMAAVLAEGTTIIRNAAREPEVVDLIGFLTSAGAKIEGAGTDTIRIEGVQKLHSTKHRVIGDRIEAFSYMIAAAITNSRLVLTGINFFDMLESPINILRSMKVNVEKSDDYTVIVSTNNELNPINYLETGVFPGFPTDCQATLVSLLGLVRGTSTIKETIFENRYMHVSELNRLGANIIVENDKAIINGVDRYSGAEITATDLRAGMGLVLAGIGADGITKINNIHHIERGYENLIDKLSGCGADIKIIDE